METEGEILSPAVHVLLGIMVSKEFPEGKCLEAAKAVIEYEVSPGVYTLVAKYLLDLAENPRHDVALRLEALKTLRKVEARRVVPGEGFKDDPGLAEQMRAGRERVAARAAGQQPPLRLVSTEEVAGSGIAAKLQRARLGKPSHQSV